MKMSIFNDMKLGQKFKREGYTQTVYIRCVPERTEFGETINAYNLTVNNCACIRSGEKVYPISE